MKVADGVELHSQYDALSDFQKDDDSLVLIRVLGKLQNAVHVDLSDNQLDGTFESISDNSAITDSLKYLNVSHNKLSGELYAKLPVPIFDILEVFDASHNELKGNVSSFNFIFSLRILRLGNNQLSGSLPEALLKDNSMVIEEVDLSCNQLTGNQICVLFHLKSVHLINNDLHLLKIRIESMKLEIFIAHNF